MADAAELLQTIRGVGGDPADLPFWEGCRRGEFLLHRCDICERHYWPASQCTQHGDQSMRWVPAAGSGALFTYTVLHKALVPSMKDQVPYVVGVVQLDEGPFFHTNIAGCGHDDVEIGMRLRAVMVVHDNGMTIPVFEPVEEQAHGGK